MKYQSVIINNKIKLTDLSQIKELLEENLNENFSINNFNHLIISGEGKNSIGISEVNHINEWIFAKSSETRFVFILSAEKLTEEAQNSLLKLIEEPSTNVLIVLVTTNTDGILGTIRSRCFTINSHIRTLQQEGQFRKLAETFLDSNFLKRGELIDKMIADDLSREELNNFLVDLLHILSQKDNKNEVYEIIKEIYRGIKSGTSIRLSLDYLNITLEIEKNTNLV